MSILYGLVFAALGLALAVFLGLVLYPEKDKTKAPDAASRVARVGKPIKA